MSLRKRKNTHNRGDILPKLEPQRVQLQEFLKDPETKMVAQGRIVLKLANNGIKIVHTIVFDGACITATSDARIMARWDLKHRDVGSKTYHLSPPEITDIIPVGHCTFTPL